MESDIEETENDFRTTKTFKRQKPLTPKKKTASKPKKVKKEDVCLKLTTKKVKENPSADGNSTTDNNTDSASSDHKGAQTGDSEKELETSHCPSCGKMFDVALLPDHVKVCLHENFEACKLVRGENIGYVQRSAFKSAGEKLSRGRTSIEWSFCTICGTDLSSLNWKQRNLHMNRCLDSTFCKQKLSKPANMIARCRGRPTGTSQKRLKTVKKAAEIDSGAGKSSSNAMKEEKNDAFEEVKNAPPQENEFQEGKCNVEKESKTPRKVKKTKTTAQNKAFRCSLCLVKVCSSRSGLTRHMCLCQKKHKIKTACAMALNKPHNNDNDFADDEILSQIRRVDNHDNKKAEEKVKLAPKVRKKRHPREEKKKIDKHEENMLQLALRVSAGDDLERKKSKKRNTIRFPVMIELSPNTKRKELEGRFRSITNPPIKESGDDIPSTPALPPSNLTNTKTNISRRKRTFDTSGRDYDQPGPSGISAQPETLNTNANNGSQPSTSSTHHIFSNVMNDELQSPEVSSSSIKPMSLTDNNDAHCLNVISMGSDDQVTVHNSPSQSAKKCSTAQRSNWSLACNEASTSNSDYRVRNLLSQFDKSSHPEDSSHAESECDVRPISDVPRSSTSDIAHVKESMVDADHIDSTLAIMKELDEAVDDDSLSRLDEDFFDEQISSSQQSESHMIHKLIDNPEFSDAKIYVGNKREVINLHRNILYCNCSELLKEINEAAAKEETVCLENYTKREVMPMICFIYSGKIEPLVNAAKHDLNLFAKTEELLKKYAVLITDTDQMMLDAAVEQHQVKAQGWDKTIDDLSISRQHNESFGGRDISISEETGGNNDDKDCVSEKSEESFSDDLLPRNLTQQDPADEVNPFRNMSDASASDYDLFACYNKSGDVGLPVQQISSDVCDDNHESDPADPVANDFLSDLHDSMFSEDNSVSRGSSFLQGEDSFSMSDVATSSPRSHSKNESVPRAKKRKKKDVTDVPVRKSQRVSLGRGRRSWHHRNCICCSLGDHCHEDGSKKAGTSEKLSKLPTSKGLRKSLLSKRVLDSIAAPNRRKIGKVGSRSPHKYKANALNKGASSQTGLTSTPSPISAPRKRKSQPKSDKNSPKNSAENPKILEENNKQNRTLLSQKKPYSPTIYIGERLPRFKQREHIRSRPEVANMGKSTRGLSRRLNRKTLSNKNARKKKKSSTPVVLDSKNHNIANFKELAKPRKDKTITTEASAQSTEVVSETKHELPQVNPVTENMDTEDESAKIVSDNANPLISSKPLSSVAMETGTDDESTASICVKQKPEDMVRKEYKFKKVCLAATYALPSPLKQPKVDVKQTVMDVAINNSDEHIEDDLLNDSFVNKFLNVSSKSGCVSHPGEKLPDISSKTDIAFHPDAIMSVPTTPVVETDECSRRSLLYIGPVPITPMPDFKSMPTPEVLHRASRIGLKKTLSKVKLKAKLEENYLYHHQIEPEESFVDNVEDLEVNNSDNESGETVKLKDVTSQNLYLFIQLPVEEILTLSTDVVDKIHKNGALLDALLSRKSETGKIKRGSRQDRARCWDMVTPGSPHYDPKLSAIVSLSEDIQNAITRPMTGCVARNYFEHKKYQFECLRFLCDEIELLYKERYSS